MQATEIAAFREDSRSFTCLYPLGGGVVPPGGAFPQQQLQGVLFTADGTPLYRPEGSMVPERQQHCLVRLQAYLVRAHSLPLLCVSWLQRSKHLLPCGKTPVR